MVERMHDEVFGDLEYNESFFTGKKSLKVNGNSVEKQGKNLFALNNGEKYVAGVLSGNYFTGVKLAVDGRVIRLVKPVTWYEVTLTVIMMVFFLVWGNVPSLCEMFPVVGGAIGGAIVGFMSAMNLICMKLVKPVWAKPLVWLGFAGATLGISYGVAMAIISVL